MCVCVCACEISLQGEPNHQEEVNVTGIWFGVHYLATGVYTYALDKNSESVNSYCFAMYSTFCMLQLTYLAMSVAQWSCK